LVIIVWLAARYAALGTLTGASPSRVENPLVDASFTTTLLTAGALHFHAISLFVFPATLLADYSLSTIPPSVSLDGASIAGWLLLLAAAAGIVTAFKRDPPLSFALTLWLGPYLLVSHLGVTMPTYFAERVLYLPSAGLVLALGWTLATVSQRWPIEKPALAFVGIAGVLLTWRSVVRVDDWQDNATLHARTMEDAPDNVKALCNAAGEFLALGYDEAALAAISHALKVDDSVALVHVNAATLYTSLGQQAEAKQHLDRVAELHEGSVRLSAARCAYAARFDPPSAKEPCKRATESQFADVESWMFRAMAADRVGDAADAEASFQHAFASSSLPPVKLLYNYAMFLARQRRFEQARELLQVATRRDPASEEVRVGLQRVEAVMRGR
jgi:Tfp pilus assembly protein PilF